MAQLPYHQAPGNIFGPPNVQPPPVYENVVQLKPSFCFHVATAFAAQRIEQYLSLHKAVSRHSVIKF